MNVVSKALDAEPDLSTVDGLVQVLELQAALLIAVATGGPRIESVQPEYQDRRQRLLRALERRELPYPFPWADLWQWYGHWTRLATTWATHIGQNGGRRERHF